MTVAMHPPSDKPMQPSDEPASDEPMQPSDEPVSDEDIAANPIAAILRDDGWAITQRAGGGLRVDCPVPGHRCSFVLPAVGSRKQQVGALAHARRIHPNLPDLPPVKRRRGPKAQARASVYGALVDWIAAHPNIPFRSSDLPEDGPYTAQDLYRLVLTAERVRHNRKAHNGRIVVAVKALPSGALYVTTPLGGSRQYVFDSGAKIRASGRIERNAFPVVEGGKIRGADPKASTPAPTLEFPPPGSLPPDVRPSGDFDKFQLVDRPVPTFGLSSITAHKAEAPEAPEAPDEQAEQAEQAGIHWRILDATRPGATRPEAGLVGLPGGGDLLHEPSHVDRIQFEGHTYVRETDAHETNAVEGTPAMVVAEWPPSDTSAGSMVIALGDEVLLVTVERRGPRAAQ